ncbi:MAG: hypothetical protein ACKOYM_00400, partial [Actinomycetes bacterium]
MTSKSLKRARQRSDSNSVTTTPPPLMRRVRSRGASVAVVVALVATVLVAGASSAQAGATSPPASAPGSFHPIRPTRLLDTRKSLPCVGSSGGGRTVQVTTAPGALTPVPTDAAAVALNVTVVGAKSSGYLTVYPADVSQPTTSNLNFVTNQTVANAVTVKLSAAGSIKLFGSGTSCPHAVIDVAGWYAKGAPAAAGGFAPLTPVRLLDTRTAGQGPCITGARRLVVAGRGGVPADATSVTLNLTTLQASGPGYLTVYPDGAARPTVSTVNYLRQQTVPNAATVKLGASGAIQIYASGGCPQVLVDVAGAYASGTPIAEGGLTPVTPQRLLDTRSQGSCVANTRQLTITDLSGTPVPDGAGAVMVNVTVTRATSGGYVTVYPSDATLPKTSSVNFAKGQTIPNAVAVKLSSSGAISI